MITTTDLKEAMYRNREFFFKQVEHTKREIDYKKINSELITIITGIRRSGKSYLIKIIKDELLKKNIEKKQIFYLNLNDPFLIKATIKDIYELINIYKRELEPKQKIYYFFDEIQELKDWHKLILDLFENKNKVIVTGSNSNLLSKEIGTYLTGRNNQIELFPFSFKEYLDFKKIKIDLKQSKEKLNKYIKEFEEYLIKGGFPLYLKEKNPTILKDYYENILNRDIIVRHSLANGIQIKELSFFIMSNPTSIQSYEKIRKTLQIKSVSTVKQYIDYLKEAYLIMSLDKFDYSIRKQILNPKKYYVIDNGFITQVSFKFSDNLGKLLENLVFIELKRRNKEIYYELDKQECDFLIKEKNKLTTAIQVCYELNTENKEREITGLKKAMKKYDIKQGFILTNNTEYEIENIKIKPVWKWLIE